MSSCLLDSVDGYKTSTYNCIRDSPILERGVVKRKERLRNGLNGQGNTVITEKAGTWSFEKIGGREWV